MAVAISGCIIKEDNANKLSYQKKCESCGYVLPGTTSRGGLSPYSDLNSSFRCPKCGNNQKIVIKGK